MTTPGTQEKTFARTAPPAPTRRIASHRWTSVPQFGQSSKSSRVTPRRERSPKYAPTPRSSRRLRCDKIATMAALQSTAELQDLLGRLDGREIAGLQVLAINSLKSLSPAPDALAGETVTGTAVSDRIITISTTRLQVTIDLQRTARLVWLVDAQPHTLVAGSSRPTARLLLADGQGLDLTEPAKTKRISVRIAPLAT